MGVSIVQWMMAGVLAVVHPFFISMTEINHQAANKNLEVSVRIFTDDFEQAIEKSCHCKVDLLNPANKTANEKLVSNYINAHLQLLVDGKPVQLVFEGYQHEEASTWNYFEVKNVASVKKVGMINTLLYEYRNEQINMVHMRVNGKDKSDKLDYPEKSLVLEF